MCTYYALLCVLKLYHIFWCVAEQNILFSSSWDYAHMKHAILWTLQIFYVVWACRKPKGISERRYSVPRMTLAVVRSSARSTQHDPQNVPLLAEGLRYHACCIWYQPFWYRTFRFLGTVWSAFEKLWQVAVISIVSAFSV